MWLPSTTWTAQHFTRYQDTVKRQVKEISAWIEKGETKQSSFWDDMITDTEYLKEFIRMKIIYICVYMCIYIEYIWIILGYTWN